MMTVHSSKMTIKSAKEWNNERPPLYLLEDRYRYIRQIQADVLRFAAQTALQAGDPKLFSAFSIQADQLDPKLKAA